MSYIEEYVPKGDDSEFDRVLLDKLSLCKAEDPRNKIKSLLELPQYQELEIDHDPDSDYELEDL